jgi:hypothetical protein
MDFSRPVSIERLDGRKLRVHFADGKEGVVDFAPLIEPGTVFERFAEESYFSCVRINPELRVLEWPGGVDIAPETLYHDATGIPLPAWMER